MMMIGGIGHSLNHIPKAASIVFGKGGGRFINNNDSRTTTSLSHRRRKGQSKKKAPLSKNRKPFNAKKLLDQAFAMMRKLLGKKVPKREVLQYAQKMVDFQTQLQSPHRTKASNHSPFTRPEQAFRNTMNRWDRSYDAPPITEDEAAYRHHDVQRAAQDLYEATRSMYGGDPDLRHAHNNHSGGRGDTYSSYDPSLAKFHETMRQWDRGYDAPPLTEDEAAYRDHAVRQAAQEYYQSQPRSSEDDYPDTRIGGGRD